MTYLVEARKNMRKADDRSPTLVNLVKNIVAEKLNDVSVPSLAPSCVSRESARFLSIRRKVLGSNRDALWALVDKTKFGK